MITRLRKAQDSWIAKGILILTALSFMSLFGISGYISSAAGNRAVIRVNNQEISQYEMDVKLDHEIRTAQKLFGDIDVTDEIRNTMLANLVQRNLDTMIVDETALKNKVSISDTLIRNIIFSQPQFIGQDGKFNTQQFNYFLSQSNLTENQYVDMIRHDLLNQFLVQNPVAEFNIPAVLKKYVAQAEAQRKIFKYIEIEENDDLIKNEISDEEIEQYYSDFSVDFVEPETRDVEFLMLSMEDMTKKLEISDEEIDEYYKNNINLFSTPEKRHVLQMVFDNQKDAEEAKKALDNKGDFYKVAQEKAHQTKEETNLEYIAEDMLLEEIAADVFTAPKNKVVGPLQSQLGWHIMKVIDVKEGSVEDLAKSHQKVKQTLAEEKVYETSYDMINDIEDKIGAGSSLQDIAKDMGVHVYGIKGLKEDRTVEIIPEKYRNLLQNNDFIDTAFSYNKDEISQFVETDEGYAFVRVVNIVDSHPQDMKTALPKIKQMWRENEKAAIAQEIINDVVSDLENGDTMEDVATRYKLKVVTTSPLARSESFAGLVQPQMIELFNESLGTPKVISRQGKNLVVVAEKEAESKKLKESEMEIISQRLKLDITQQAAEALTNAYSKDYDVRVKYRLLGLAD